MLNSENGTEPPSRRTLLRALGATLAGTSLAGCQDQIRSYEFVAMPAGLSEKAREKFGYSTPVHEVRVDERTTTTGGVETEVTVQSHAITYGSDDFQRPDHWPTADPDAASVGVLSAPQATVAGQEHNPLASKSLSEIVTGPRGRDLLRQAGLDAGGQLSLLREPERVATRENLTMLEEPTTMHTYAGIERGQDTGTGFLLHVTRVQTQGDAVIVVVLHQRALQPRPDLEEIELVDADGIIEEQVLVELLGYPLELLPLVTFDPPIEAEDVGRGAPGLHEEYRPSEPASESLRHGTFNAQFLPDIAEAPPLKHRTICCDDIPNRVERVADRIIASRYDVIALNEMLDNDTKEDMMATFEDECDSTSSCGSHQLRLTELDRPIILLYTDTTKWVYVPRRRPFTANGPTN